MSYWAVVHTQPSSERKVEGRLTQQGFKCYLPILGERKAGVFRESVLFPRYLFLFVEDQWRCVLGTFGVTRVLLDNDRPARLPTRFVEELKGRENRKGYIEIPRERYRRGERIKITGGVFEGQYGLNVSAKHSDREIILLDILGSVELASSDLF